jgi:hypothetical protein
MKGLDSSPLLADAMAILSLSARWKAGGSDPPCSPPESSINYSHQRQAWKKMKKQSIMKRIDK